MKKLLLTSVAALFLATGAVAEDNKETTRQIRVLYKSCLEDKPSCTAFLMGIAGVQAYLGKVYNDPEFKETTIVAGYGIYAICPPKDVQSMLRERFMYWVENYALEDFSAITGAMEAFRTKWPCKENEVTR